MPTTTDEAKKITEIICNYMEIEDALACATDLDEQVGAKTENESLQITLHMLRELLEEASKRLKQEDEQYRQAIMTTCSKDDLAFIKAMKPNQEQTHDPQNQKI